MPGPWLPHLLRELTDALGVEAGEACARAYGGQRLYVPKKVSADHVIARELGTAVMGWLVDRYGGTEVAVPQGTSSIIRQKFEEAKTLVGAGVSIRQAARQTGLHLRTVERMLKREGASPSKASSAAPHYRRDERQIGLFD